MTKRAGTWLGAPLLLLLSCLRARAEVALEGSFVAARACPALQSLRKGSNPGIVLSPGHSYRILAKNKEAATHFLVQVDGAHPDRRWVEATCGQLVTAATALGPQAGGGETPAPASDGSPGYVFALSWQPAFCEGKSTKPECAAQTAEAFEASHFTLHGLWPQPRDNSWCNVSDTQRRLDREGRWEELPAVALSDPLRARLDERMPGTRSHLERHEWIKHGTCHGTTAEIYFREAVQLLDEVNASEVRTLFTSHVGQSLKTSAIRDAFDSAFGSGAGRRVRVNCARDGERRLIVELTLGLSGPITEQKTLAELLAAAPPTGDPGCPDGIVDPVGFQ